MGKSAPASRGRSASELVALLSQSLLASSQGYPYFMADKKNSEPTRAKHQTSVVTVLGVLLGILGILAAAAGFIMYVSRAEIGKELQGPLSRLATVENDTRRIPGIEATQRDIEKNLMALATEFRLYFGKQSLDKTKVQSIADDAVTTAVETKDPAERAVALRVARNVLSKASDHHVTMNPEKTNRLGLKLLAQKFEGADQTALRDALSELARQRTLIVSPPPSRSPDFTYIVDKEQTLDGTAFKNVTFVNCTIIYGDGWLNLNNVRFINCIFDVAPETGKDIYQALFKSLDPIPTVSAQTRGHGPDPTGKSSS